MKKKDSRAVAQGVIQFEINALKNNVVKSKTNKPSDEKSTAKTKSDLLTKNENTTVEEKSNEDDTEELKSEEISEKKEK